MTDSRVPEAASLTLAPAVDNRSVVTDLPVICIPSLVVNDVPNQLMADCTGTHHGR